MSNLLLAYPNYADVSALFTPVLSGGSWNPSLPLTNLQDRRLDRVARSADAAITSTVIKADLQTARAVRIVGLPRHTLSSAALARVRGMGAVPFFEDSAFTAWAIVNTPIRTAGQTDPFGGTAATLMQDDDAVNVESMFKAVAFTADGTKWMGISLKQGTSGFSTVSLFDSTASVGRIIVKVTWTAGVPSLAITSGGGVLYAPIALAGGWWFIQMNVNGVVAANTNQIILYATDATGSSVGSTYFYEAMASNLPTQLVLHDSGVVAAWPAGVTIETAQTLNVGFVDALAAAVTAQYWRVELADPANAAGSIDLGRLFIGGAYQPTINAEYGLKLGWDSDSTATRADGGALIHQDKPRWRTASLVLDLAPTDESLTGPFDMMGLVGTSTQVYFVYDPSDTTHLFRRSFLATLKQLSALEFAYVDRTTIPLELVEEL